jgi:hypothetical protein
MQLRQTNIVFSPLSCVFGTIPSQFGQVACGVTRNLCDLPLPALGTLSLAVCRDEDMFIARTTSRTFVFFFGSGCFGSIDVVYFDYLMVSRIYLSGHFAMTAI